jgi:hypothetical protein
VNETASSGCGTCGKGIPISIRSEKWGQCAFCAAVALAGALTGWSFTLALWFLYPGYRVTIAVASLSACFTLFLVLHLVAYLLRLTFRSSALFRPIHRRKEETMNLSESRAWFDDLAERVIRHLNLI